MPKPIFLTKEKAAKVHETTIQVLEHTGIDLNHEEAEELYLAAGATKDQDGRILIPRQLVQEALIKVRRRVQLYDRDGRKAVMIRKGPTYFGPGSDALYSIDRHTRQFRRSTLQDVRDNVRVADALGEFDFVMSMGLPVDVAPRALYATVFAEMVKNTTKPLVATATTCQEIRQIHKIAAVAVGGEERLRQRPFFLAYLEPISPLRIERSIAERVLYCAEHDIPMLFAAGANCGGGAPITPEGGLVQGGAESLAGLVLAILKNENVRFLYGANTSVLDMRTSIVCYGAPEWFRTVAMYADMGKYYNLASWGTAGCSDSFCIDAQAAMEAYEGIVLAVLSGTTLAHDVGFLAHGTLYDVRMLVLTAEMIRRARYVFKEADVSDQNLAPDVIDEVSRTNSLYLAHPHTFEVFRNVLWLPPSYINRKNIDEYVQARDLSDILGEEVDRLLDTHQPKPLRPDRVHQIDQYLASLASA